MKIDLEQAKIICNQALPFSVYNKLEDKEIIGSANCILLWSTGILQRLEMANFEMTVKFEEKDIKG